MTSAASPLKPRRRGALETQGAVIGALIMRELHTRFGRENIGYLWVFAEPMILATAVAAIHARSGGHSTGPMQPVPFALVGYTVFILFRSVVLRAEGALEANRPLLYHRMVTVGDMLIARALLEGASTVMALTLMLGGSVVLGLAEPPARPLALLGAMLLVLWFAFGLSALVSAGSYFSRAAGRLLHPVIYLALPLSGAFFMVKWIPQPFRDMVAWIPLTQMFELVRYGQFAAADLTYVDLPYIVGWCLVLSFIGLLSLSVVRPRLHLD
jgi:capsular polysaccharide transport system permease protein